jgi:hypothetical protein
MIDTLAAPIVRVDVATNPARRASGVSPMVLRILRIDFGALRSLEND